VSKALDLDGLTMSYEDEGTGAPVIMVHGNPTWSFYWRSLTKALPAHGFRALAPDHIGMGRSDKPQTGYAYTLASRVHDFGRFVDSLDLAEPISLIVHDWGGAIGLAWAVENPDRIDKLVLLNTAAFPLPAKMKLALKAARWPVIGEFAVTRLNAFSLGAVVMATGKAVLPSEARRGLLAPYKDKASRKAVHAFVKDIPLRDSDPAYPVLKRLQDRLPLLAGKPMLICWGMKDFVFDTSILAILEEAFPKAEVRRYAKAGHYVLEDAAGEIVPEVVRFLKA
jgi:pimeloyl-ACP methyl ester carboxylesterase